MKLAPSNNLYSPCPAAAFDAALANDEAKVKRWHTDAYEVKKAADDMVLHIEHLKQYLIAKTDGLDTTVVFGYVNDWPNFELLMLYF